MPFNEEASQPEVEECESCGAEDRDDCDCWYCDACEGRHDEDTGSCPSCDNCYDQCGCYQCDNCGERYRTVSMMHGECDRCVDCCECSDDDDDDDDDEGATPVTPYPTIPLSVYEERDDDRTVEKTERQIYDTKQSGIFKEERFKFWPAEQFTRNSLKRFLAAEIEVAGGGGLDLTNAASKWKASIKEDGSIHYGYEITTSPANGDLFVQQIEELTEAARKHHGYIDAACGLHIHADARDFSDEDLAKLSILWTRVEDALFRMMPKTRRENKYCEPSAIQFIRLKTKSNNDLDRLGRLLLAQSERYMALNFLSFIRHKTVECRLHTGTLLPEKIVPWAKLFGALVESAKTLTLDQINGLPGNPTDALVFLSPDEETTQYIRMRQEKFSAYKWFGFKSQLENERMALARRVSEQQLLAQDLTRGCSCTDCAEERAVLESRRAEYEQQRQQLIAFDQLLTEYGVGVAA